ncbi:MAG: choice-of-anchor C family protein [Pseudomonadota bacterium]
MKHLISALALSAGLATGAQAAVVNGSFEDPGTVTGNWATYSAGSNALTGWTIDSGSIDLINAFWQHSDGNYSINLDGTSPGTISQMLTGLTVGRAYTLAFDMAANTADPNQTVGLTASVGRNFQSYSFDKTGFSRSNMGWVTYTLGFTASADSMLLSFASDSPSGFYGAALDNISVTSVPVPASGLLLLAAMGGLALRARKTA